MDRPVTRLSIVAPGLRCGGVERSVTTMAGVLARRGFRVTVLTYDDARSDFFSLPPEVERVPLALRSAPAPLPALIPRMYRTLRSLRAALLASDPHVVIAHMARINVHTLLALKGVDVPIIVTEHGDVAPGDWHKALWYRLRRTCYRSAFRVVSVSEAVGRNFTWVPDERRTVIANPIAVRRGSAESPPEPRNEIVSVGRLSHAKGFDILVAAWARIAARYPHWRLVVIGDGEERATLERQAAALQLRERILFTGALADPTWFLRRAKLFVMASRYEGFPLAHAEALACGLPVVATDCPSRPLAKGEQFVAGGIRELVRADVNGLLVPPENPNALARAMAALITDQSRRDALAKRAPEVLVRLAPERIADAWQELIAQALSTSSTSQRGHADARPCVVITGPVKSAISGISTHVSLLTAALRHRLAVVHFPIGGEGLREGVIGRALRLFFAPIQLALLLHRRRPSVVHINTSMSWRACIRDALVVATCHLCNQRFILQFHGGRPPHSASWTAHLGRRVLGRLLRMPERVVTISREDETFYRSVVSPAKVVWIPNGVEVPGTPQEHPARFEPGRLRLLHFGRLAEDKGLLDILDALALLSAQRRPGRISLTVAGAGPLLSAARRRAELHRLGNIVSFVGAAFGAQKEALMAHSDLFVLPTYHEERLPYALLESMAAGVVPITCRAGAIADVVQHEREGFLVQPRDPQGLSSLLAALLKDPVSLPQMSAACRERIRESYSLERMANAFGAVYAEVTAPERAIGKALGAGQRLR